MATAKARALANHLATLGNLRTMVDDPRPVLAHPHTLRGVPAVLVGAGWTLDRDGQHLPRLASGALVVTVNTALPAVLRHGVDPDVLVTIEAMDMTHQWEGLTEASVVCGLQSHAAAFAKADACMVGCTPTLLNVCGELDVPMIAWGSSAMTAAYALVRFLGCSPIVFVGMDMCVDPEGQRAYASGAGWDGQRVKREGDTLVFEGRPDRDELHRSHGVPPQPRRRPVVEVGDCVTYDDLAQQAQWFVDHVRPEHDAYNGCHTGLPLGAQRWPLEALDVDPLDGPRPSLAPALRTPSQGQREAAMAEVRRQAEVCHRLIDSMNDKGPLDMGALVQGVEFVDGLCHQDWLHLKDADMPVPARLTATYATLRAAARRVLE